MKSQEYSATVVANDLSEAVKVTPSMKFSRRGFIVSALALSACKRGAALLELSGNTMGTSYSIAAVDHERSVDKAALNSAISATLSKVNAQMSNWDASSEVSRFNSASSITPITVSPELAQVVAAAADVSRATDGQFDITLGPVIEAWGFGAKSPLATHEPSAAVLAQALDAAGQTESLRANTASLQKSRSDTQIYLSSIGKGFGVDEVARTVASFGIKDFMVEIGGDLYLAGANTDGQPWQIGIESPDAVSHQAYDIAQVSNMGMATSGDYRNYFEKDGQRFSHIIDAKTGRPVSHNTASVTVLAENAMLADAWATAMLVVGSKRGLEIANDRDLAVMFIDREGKAGQKGFKTASSTRFAALQA